MLSFLTLSIGSASVDIIILLLAFLTLKPQVTNCVFRDPQPDGMDAACTLESICGADSTVVHYEIDWTKEGSLHNWVEKFDLLCRPKVQSASLGACFFLGWVCTLWWVPRFSDMFSRKKIFGIGLFVNLLVYVAILAANKLEQICFLILVLGFFTTTRSSVSYVYLLELVPKRIQSSYGGLFVMVSSLIIPITVLYFWFVSNDWIYIHYFGIGCQVVCLVCLYFIPESPRLLIEL